MSDDQASTAENSNEISSNNESYFDIVWQQFKKNTFAYVSLWMLAPMFLLAIFAPLIASNKPFIYYDNGQAIYPWARALFNPDEPIDYLFNMALVGFFPWLLLAVLTNWRWLRRGVSPRRRLGLVLLQYPVIILTLCYLFWQNRPIANPLNAAWPVHAAVASVAFLLWIVAAPLMNLRARGSGDSSQRRSAYIAVEYLVLLLVVYAVLAIPNFHPTNKFKQGDFPAEEFQAQANASVKGQTYGVYPPIPFGPLEIDVPSRFRPPLYRKPADKLSDSNDGFLHILGTGDNGKDVLVRMIYGTRISMSVGFVAVGIYMTIGVIVGAIAGYFGGITDIIISRIIEIVLLFPSFFLILTLVALIGPSIYMIMVVIGFTGWPRIARLIRGEVLKQRSTDYATAARALGSSHARIIFRHILPNAISPALVSAPFGIASAIIIEAGLSLLGFGVRPPAPSWGAILKLAHGNYDYWWLIVIPSLAMFVTVTVFNLVGSGLRDAMDPRLRI